VDEALEVVRSQRPADRFWNMPLVKLRNETVVFNFRFPGRVFERMSGANEFDKKGGQS
jgi:hypothetical protein